MHQMLVSSDPLKKATLSRNSPEKTYCMPLGHTKTDLSNNFFYNFTKAPYAVLDSVLTSLFPFKPYVTLFVFPDWVKYSTKNPNESKIRDRCPIITNCQILRNWNLFHLATLALFIQKFTLLCCWHVLRN